MIPTRPHYRPQRRSAWLGCVLLAAVIVAVAAAVVILNPPAAVHDMTRLAP